jgi:Flp pilus assembly protein TadG
MMKSRGGCMSVGNSWRAFKAQVKALITARRGNVAMIFALSIVPMTIAAGGGVDLARALIIRARIAEALDSAGLAVGASSGLTTAQIQKLAQNYFNANYTADSSFGTPAAVTVTQGTQSVTLSTSVQMPTTLMRVADYITSPGQFDYLNVGYSSQVVWGQTKLWVSLVLDNTGSMTQTDQSGTSKISALITATNQLLGTLQGAAATNGDVEVAIVPFSKDVNVGNTTTTRAASWIDWTDWLAAPANSTPGVIDGPGTACPYSTNTSPYGYGCQSSPSNGSSSVSTIPSSGTYKGYICPGVDNGNYNSGRLGHYYNGCYTSTNAYTLTTTCTTPRNGSTTCNTVQTNGAYNGSTSQSCSGSNPKICITKNPGYSHAWVANATTTWSGCVMDRAQDYDISNTPATSTGTDYPAENAQSCVPTVMMGTLSYNWSALTNEVNSMTAGGSTDQPIGLAWGWQSQSTGNPFNAGTVPNNTSQYIILLSDGLNTQDRWYGDGSDQSTQVDGRMTSLCTSAKAAGITIYAIYVDLNGTQGNSTVLQNCASDSSKYFDLTTSGAIISTLSNIAEQITQLRVAQ